MLRPDTASNVSNTCVLPVLEYGAGLWGAGAWDRKGDKAAWASLEAFLTEEAKTILSAPLRTPNAAVVGELGWRKLRARASVEAVN